MPVWLVQGIIIEQRCIARSRPVGTPGSRQLSRWPLGQFITVDGVKLHYLVRGEGPPIVLLHGNGTMIQDWLVSGVLDNLAATNQVIAFDRPGCGYGERPRSTVWTPKAQAELISHAIAALGLERPCVVAHSLGTLVALALAVHYPQSVSRLVLLGGYYFPTARLDAVLGSPPAIPVIGDAIRYTVSPILGAASVKLVNRALFSPAPVSDRWQNEFPIEMSLRPSQIRATAEDGAVMVPAAAALANHYGELTFPVMIIAGRGDKIADFGDQSERLHKELPHSRLIAAEETGHMVHHTRKAVVVHAIQGLRDAQEVVLGRGGAGNVPWSEREVGLV